MRARISRPYREVMLSTPHVLKVLNICEVQAKYTLAGRCVTPRLKVAFFLQQAEKPRRTKVHASVITLWQQATIIV